MTLLQSMFLPNKKRNKSKDKKSSEDKIIEITSGEGTSREEEKVEITELSDQYKKIPIEERTLAKKTSAAPQGIIE
jgi:hypothetical protein